MTGPLKDQTVLVIGRGGGIARAITLAAQDAGAQVIAVGRDQASLGAIYGGEPSTFLTGQTLHIDGGEPLT